MRKCKGPCGLMKPLSEFQIQNRGLRGVCKLCHNAWNREQERLKKMAKEVARKLRQEKEQIHASE